VIDILTIRGPGDADGGEVFDPLLSSVEAAVQRGRYEIDQSAPIQNVNLDCVYTPTLQVGSVIEALDITTGLAVRGIIKSFTHVVDGVVVFTSISLEVPV